MGVLRILFSALEFRLTCTNTTPTYLSTNRVSGRREEMEWVPGTVELLETPWQPAVALLPIPLYLL